MTVAVSWVGNGRQFTADIATDTVTVVKYSGSGGTPSAAAADGSIQGSNALTVTVNKTGIAMFVAVPTALDFTTTESGELIYVWGAFLASSLLAAQASNGFGICLSSGAPTASNYSLFSFYGNDNYSGGWKRMVLDPTKTRSGGSGTLTTSNITHIGVFADVAGATARFDNLLLDAVDVGTGLKVTGTSTLGLIEELLANEATNRYGVVTALNDSESAVELAGTLTLGDDTGTLATTITDEDSKIFVAEPLYYQSSIKAAVPLDYASINSVGNGTGATSIIIGQAVGTDSGRSGWSVVGNSTYDVGMDFDDGNVNTAEWYGCAFQSLSGTLAWGTNTGHKSFNNTLSGCEQFDPVGGVQIRNCNFVSLYDDGTADASKNSALLWNGSINIQDCNFLANTHSGSDIAHGIEHPASGTFTYTNLNFSGNEIDVHFSDTTGNLTINKNPGSNPSSSTNDSAGSVSITGSVDFTLTNVVSGSTFTLDGTFTTDTPAGTYNGAGDSVLQMTGTIPTSFAAAGDVRVFNGSYYETYSYTGLSGAQLTGVAPTLSQDFDGENVLLEMIAPTTISVDPYTVSVESSQAFEAMLSNQATTRYIPIQFSDTTGSGFARRISQIEE